jgi:hypothetical protein
MSEAPRIYSVGLGKRRRRGRWGAVVRWTVVIALLSGVVWFFWSTRDSYSMAELIPAEAQYRVYINGLVPKREEIVSAAVWSLAPPESMAGQLQAQLAANLGFPEWILNNLIYGLCQFSGNDTDQYSDMLFVTRMSRIGCIIERFRGFAIDVEDDPAGGLELRRIREPELYYAVRGRVLVLSPSRKAIINAVTLMSDEALPEAALETAANAVEEADVYGNVALDTPGDQAGPVQDLAFELHFDPASFQLSCEGRWTPEWQARLDGLLGSASPQSLTTPPGGVVEMSINLGKNVRELWQGVGAAFEDEGRMESMWAGWADPVGEDGTAFSGFLTSLIGNMGPGLRLAWRDVDDLAMIPLPEVVASADVDPALYEDLLITMPGPPADAMPFDEYPRFESEQALLYLPITGSPDLEPAAWLEGRHFVACTSDDLAGRLRGSDVSPEAPLPEPGNLFVRLRPLQAAKAAVKLAAPLAASGLLRGYRDGGFDAAAAEWQATAERVQEVTLYATFEAGQFQARMDLTMAQP